MAPQASGVVIVCALLFLEEAGLPLPVAPGEAVLIGAGLLVASGAVPIWLMAPLAYLAVICGVLSGYIWAHRIGPKRLPPLPPGCTLGGRTIGPRPGSAPPHHSRLPLPDCYPDSAFTPPWSLARWV